jgi:hypothetical protein
LPIPATTVTPAEPTTTAAEASKVAPPETIQPISTDAAATEWIPTSIAVQQPPTGTASQATSAIVTGVPTYLPQVVSPNSGTPEKPADNTLIQIGFDYELNYEFVVTNAMSSAQIFRYLPVGLAYGLKIKPEQIVMHSLRPYDTTAGLGYITTLALAYVPTSLVADLKVLVHTPVSLLYQNPDGSARTIVENINPAIPIEVGGELAGLSQGVIGGAGDGSGGSGSGNGGGSTGGNGGDVFDTGSKPTTVSGTTAGIAAGAVVAAAAYGAAMFFIARRYKKRKLAHRRASSVADPSEMVQSGSPALMGGAAFMSGGRQSGTTAGDRNSKTSQPNSARTAQISAPMMAENSLGWN